jgi:DNA-binding NarL/FixJ family response regulator
MENLLSPAGTRFLLVANDPLARAGLATLLTGWSEVELVGQIASEDLVRDLEIYQAEVLLWDLGWDPSEDMLDQFRDMLSDLGDPSPVGLPVLALITDEFMTADLRAPQLRGLLLRNALVDQIVAAIIALGRGLSVFDPLILASLLPSNSQKLEGLIDELTQREKEVLQLLAEGLTNRAIAHRLEVSEHTVKFHVNSLLSKLNAQSRTEAVVRATRLGLISL